MKPEKAVQDHKKICILDKKTNAIYTGAAARSLLNLPSSGTVSLRPAKSSKFDIFIQSTSTNRKVKENSRILYWPNATG